MLRYIKKKEFLILLVLLFTISLAYAVDTDNRIYFSNLKNSDRLVTTDIFSITSDTQGFIWIGSGEGLFRYDGYNLVEVKDEGLPVRVVSLVADSDYGLWIGGNGLKYLDTRNFKFTLSALQDKVIRTMYNNGEFLWIGTESGLMQFNKESNETKLYNHTNSSLSNNIVRTIFKDNKGDLWVGTSDKLNVLEKGKQNFQSFDLKQDYKPEITYNHILDIKPFEGNNDSLLWVGTETGLCRFNKNNGQYQSYNIVNSNISNDAVKSIFWAEPGKLWLGTDFGLNLFNTKTGNMEVYLHQPDQKMSIVDNVIWTIFQDHAGIFWFGTSNGISRVGNDQNMFSYFPVRNNQNGQIIGDVVKEIIPVSEVDFWLGTNHGVLYYTLNEGTITSLNSEQKGLQNIGFNKIDALHIDDLNRLWIGSGGGIYIWDKSKPAMHKITSENENARSLKSNYINKFIRASDSTFWISIWQRGLYRVTGDFKTPEQLSIELAYDVNSDLIVPGNNKLWIVDNNRLFKIDLKTNEIIPIETVNEVIKNNYIRSIYYSSSGALWLGAENIFHKYMPTENRIITHKFESKQGVKILAFEEDALGNLWMSSQNAILKYDILNDETNIFVLGNEYLLNGFVPGCSAKTKDGKLIFGGNDGMMVFNPEDIVRDSYSPKLVISGLKLYNEDIWAGDIITKQNILENNITYLTKLEIPYDNRSFTLSFSSLHFGASEKNVYSYKLEGLDNEWHSLAGSNAVNYSGLSPGKYTFKVKGTNNDGVWQDNEAKIDIRILPPFWRRWYFIVTIVFLLSGIAVTILYFFFQKKKLARKVEEEQIEKRNIAALNQAKLQFFTNISHEFRTPLSLIVGPVKKLSGYSGLDDENRKLVRLINKNASRMLRLVNQLMDFRKISNSVSSIVKTENDVVQLARETFELFVENANEKGLHFTLVSNCNELDFEFDKAKMETILFNLLSNAFKFTSKGEISFELKLITAEEKAEKNILEIVVSDTGKGIAKEKLSNIFNRFYQADVQEQTETGTGIGLSLVKKFVELHKGNIEVNSALGKGTSFKIILPIDGEVLNLNLNEFKIEVAPKNKNTELTIAAESNVDSQDMPTVLIVEDNHEMASFIGDCLKSRYKVYTESNGLAGTEKAIELLPDLIISDVMMPLKSGTELCQELKSNVNTSHIPIILLTALDATENKKVGFSLGADDYITKPFDEELLLARISGILKNKELLWKKFQLEQTTDPKKLSIYTPDQKFLNDLMRIIEENIHERDLNASLLTTELGMSHSVVYKKLKTLTGQSIVDFMRDFKLKRAAQLISENGFSVTDACYKVGFSDRRYFSKIFKMKFGTSPSGYKKALN